MSPSASGKKPAIGSFRTKLLIGMMLVVGAMTTLGLFLAERKVAIEARLDLLQDFRNELATLHGVQEVRNAAVAERCRLLAQRPRIHAALEDNALDLLYPSAKDELRDVLAIDDQRGLETGAPVLSANFYRFLDTKGAVISPPPGANVGQLTPEEEAQLAVGPVSNQQQVGYLFRNGSGQSGQLVDEVIAVPIISTQTEQVIAAVVLGFKPVEIGRNRSGTEIRSGIWVRGRLYLSALSLGEAQTLDAELGRRLAAPTKSEPNFEVAVGGMPHLVFFQQLNPGSVFPPAYEVAVYPLANAIARQKQIRTHVILAGLALLLIGLLASHLLSGRLSAPVEKLAVTSEQHRAQRVRAEEALELTSEELQRAARFSADASHQLKTPVTVLRAGIDELLAREEFPPEVYDQLSALLHQTYRITGVIDDLLLLSRMDAGRLQIQLEAVNLSLLIEEWIDDLSALPDDLHINVETDFPPNLQIVGEKRYITLIAQNLLENARKYNVPGGKICVYAREEDGFVIFSVENTGRPIPLAAQEHIFERFHRGGMGENVPGHGLGLNLARELARLHGGDLRLTRSNEEGTEFEVRFRNAKHSTAVVARSAA